MVIAMGNSNARPLGAGWRAAAVVGVNLSLGIVIAPLLELGGRVAHAHLVAPFAYPVDPASLDRSAPLMLELVVAAFLVALLTSWFVANRFLLADADGHVGLAGWAAAGALVLAPAVAPAAVAILRGLWPVES